MKLALSVDEACEAIGVSRDFFDQHIKPHVEIVYVSRRIIVPVKSLEAWMEREATHA